MTPKIMEHAIHMFIDRYASTRGQFWQVALLCHKVRATTRPPVSGSEPVIYTQLSRRKYVLPDTLDFLLHFQVHHLLRAGQEVRHA